MTLKSDSEMGVNSWLEDELYQQYLHDRSTVDESWKQVFQEPASASVNNTPPVPPQATPAATASAPAPDQQLQPLRGAAGRIAGNMAASVVIPLATSQRTIAV